MNKNDTYQADVVRRHNSGEHLVLHPDCPNCVGKTAADIMVEVIDRVKIESHYRADRFVVKCDGKQVYGPTSRADCFLFAQGLGLGLAWSR